MLIFSHDHCSIMLSIINVGKVSELKSGQWSVRIVQCRNCVCVCVGGGGGGGVTIN